MTTNTAADNGSPQGDPENVLESIRQFVSKYVAFPEQEQLDIVSLFVLHTHAFGSARTTPYLYITSAEKQSGKTRTLEVLETLCKTANRADNLTPSVMFRMIEHLSPTLMIDEVDTIFSGAKNEEMRGVLNSGYKAGGYIYRAIGNPLGEDGGLVRFGTFCPKILAGIDNGQVPDTVLDRSIRITLRRKRAGQSVLPWFPEDEADTIALLHDEISAWHAANRDALADPANRPAPVDGLSDRANEISRPLLGIAQRFPGWSERTRNALLALLTDGEEKLSPQGETLLAIREYMDQHGLDRIRSATIMELTGHNGKQLGHYLSAYGIRPRTLLIDGVNAKGFLRSQFIDSWERYLP